MEKTIPILEEKITIPSYLVDNNSNLRLDALFMLFQEMANNHASMLGAGWNELREKGFFWVITKILIKVERMPKWAENIVFRTWVKPSDTATSPRDFRIIDTSGNTLISGCSLWTILDIENNRPQRMCDFDATFSPQNDDAAPRPKKIPPLKNTDKVSQTKNVNLSDIDMNKHVNNAHYIQWAVDALDENFYNSHSIDELTVNFISQAKMGGLYRIAIEQISEDEHFTSISSENGDVVFCRLHTRWKSLADNIRQQ